MSSYHLVNIWTAPEPGGFNPMPPSLLWLPDGHHLGNATPAFVFVHGWGAYPSDEPTVTLGPQLADQGFGVLSLGLRRRGMEGQLNALPDDDLHDIRLALDYLSTNGFNQVFLVGREAGGVSVLRYAAKYRDRRVIALCWLDPVNSPADWLPDLVGAAAYDKAVVRAGLAARQGAAMDVRIDLFPDDGPPITQNALAFLAWWGPSADTRLERCLQEIAVPLAVVGDDESLQAASPPEKLSARAGQLGECLSAWANRSGATHFGRTNLELVHADLDGADLVGLCWTPKAENVGKIAVLLVHGLTSTPFSPLLTQLGPALAQQDLAVLAIGMRRSGWSGHESSVLDNDVADIDRWVEYLLDRGCEKIVLAGASIGSISVGRYLSVTQHPNVVAIAHLMPTADCPDWFRRAAGDGPYTAAVEQAEAACDAGLGATELVDIDIRQPPPNRHGSRFRWTQRAASWLSWWGPTADSLNSVHIANAHIPVLLLSGTDDSYNDEARFAELKAAAVNAPSVAEIWYPGIDHGLAGVEVQVASDLYDWIERIGII